MNSGGHSRLFGLLYVFFKKVRKTLALGYEHLPFMLSWKLFVFVFNWGGIKVKIVLQEKLQEAILRLVTKFAP